MTRTRRLLGGVRYGYVNAAVVTITGLWLTPFLIAHLGSRDLGLWFLAQQVIGYLLLLDVGVVALLPRETAYATGRAGGVVISPEVPALVGQTLRLVVWQTPVVAIAAAVPWLLLPPAWDALRWPAAIVLLTFVLLFPARVFHGLLFGLQDLAFTGQAQLGAWAINTTLTVVLLLKGQGLYAVAVGWAVSQVFLSLAWWLRARWRFPEALPPSLPAFSWPAVRAHLGKGVWVSTSQIAQVFLNGSDLLIIGRFLGPAAVVPYACTGKLISVLSNQPQIIMQTAAPALSELRTGGSAEGLARASSALTQAMLLVSGAVACVVVAVNGAFVRWWVGPSQYAGLRLTVLLTAAMLLRHWNTTAVYALFCRGYEKRISITTLVDGIVTVVVAAFAVRRLGPMAAPVGAIVGASLVSLPFNLSTLARDSGLSLWEMTLGLQPWATRFFVVLAGAIAIAIGWHPDGLTGIAMSGSLVAVAYLLIAGPIAFRPPLGTYLRPWLPWPLATRARA